MAKKLKCSKCDRSFSMPAHLARHLSAIHGKKTKAKVAKKRGPKVKRKVGRPKGVAKKKAGRPKGRGVGAARLLSGMKAYQRKLVAERGALDAQIDAVARAVKALQGR